MAIDGRSGGYRGAEEHPCQSGPLETVRTIGVSKSRYRVGRTQGIIQEQWLRLVSNDYRQGLNCTAPTKVLLDKQFIQAGIIHVCDKYRDHGCCGLYVMDGLGKAAASAAFLLLVSRSEHGCRTMGLPAAWRPLLNVVGGVLWDVFDEATEVNWLTHHVPLCGETTEAVARERRSLPPVLAPGGCDLAAVTHYSPLHSPEVVTEYNHHPRWHSHSGRSITVAPTCDRRHGAGSSGSPDCARL